MSQWRLGLTRGAAMLRNVRSLGHLHGAGASARVGGSGAWDSRVLLPPGPCMMSGPRRTELGGRVQDIQIVLTRDRP